jgi:hypothetical protein
MPRVNRDLQRRMAARRERERRRPGDRRYRFDTAEAVAQPDEALVGDGHEAEAIEAPPKPSRQAREATAATQAPPPSRASARSAPKPFSAYKDEYTYVYSDLRRVGVVIGSLLLILIVLYFVLPLLIH